MSESTTIKYEKGDDNVVTLTLDDPNQSANTMNAAFMASLQATVDRLEAEKDDIAGVVIVSAKKTFFAGGNLNDLKQVTKENAEEFAAGVEALKANLRRLEKLGRPVVSCVNGAALGGGLELCLATHHRVVVDSPKVQLGQPEVQLGLLPGAGGIVRSVRMLGIVTALMGLLVQGKPLKPAKALEMGLIDELVVLAGGARPGREEVDRGEPRGGPALGRQGLQDPRRHAVAPRRWRRTCRRSRPTCASS